MASFDSAQPGTTTRTPMTGQRFTNTRTPTYSEPGLAAPRPDYDRDAFAALKQTLGEYGLESLTQFVYDALIDGKSEAEVMRDLRETPEFKARFPAIEARKAAGLPPISPGEYVAYERQAGQLMRAAGLPKGFYDNPDDFTQFLVGDTSLAELSQRIELARDAAYSAPPETLAALRDNYGLSDGDLTAYWLDPDRAQPLLERQYRAAQISGAGARSGFGYLDALESEKLVKLGVTDTQAAETFGTLAASTELFGALDAGEDSITREEQLSAGFENGAQARRRIEERRRRRQAQFEGGGGLVDSQQGVTGLADTSRR